MSIIFKAYVLKYPQKGCCPRARYVEMDKNNNIKFYKNLERNFFKPNSGITHGKTTYDFIYKDLLKYKKNNNSNGIELTTSGNVTNIEQII